MNEQEMVLRVGELAGRVGYPMPTVSWVKGPPEQACIMLEEDRKGSDTLVLHEQLNEKYSPEEQDFLIAQEIIQARLGRQFHHRRIRTAVKVVLFVGWFVAALIANPLLGSAMLAFPAALVGGYAAAVLFQMAVAAVWTRWFFRRADGVLIETLGRDHVLRVLNGHAACQPPTQLRCLYRRLLSGAPPYARERLRMLGEPVLVGAEA